MFAEKYKRAYDAIAPSPEKYNEVLTQADAVRKAADTAKRRTVRRMSAAEDRAVRKTRLSAAGTAAVAAAVLLCIFSVLPACAVNSPAFYRVIEFISPALADRLVPIEESSSSQGVTMEVEAISLEGNEAEIIVSMRDEEGSPVDRIHGEIDLFDSYDLLAYGSETAIGGCSFLTYDAETDKAYFRIRTQASGTYQADKLRFSVREILCDKSRESREIDLSGLRLDAGTRVEELSGLGGMMEEAGLPSSLGMTTGAGGEPPWKSTVLDLARAQDCAADDFTVTGSAYMDGVLRLQICMGDSRHADRHVQVFLRDAAGEEKHEDYSVSWKEAVGDTEYQFYEFWFIGELDKIEDCSMYGIFYNSGESIEGRWEVTFRVES